MFEEETTKQHWLKIASIALITFIVAFLAFYIVMEIMVRRIANPVYDIKRIEHAIQKQERNFNRYDYKFNENPFEPKMRPMIVNLVKEPSEYKVIVDLKPLDGNEKTVNVQVNGDELIVSGQMDKNIRGTEKIISFSQSYYLDEKLDTDKMIKEKKGDKYIITIPFED